MSTEKRPKLFKPDNGKLFAKPRREEAERLARLERRAEGLAIEASQTALIYKAAAQDEAAAWTADKSRKTAAARLAAEEAESEARATALAVRIASAQWNAREAIYTKAETTVSTALKKLTKK